MTKKVETKKIEDVVGVEEVAKETSKMTESAREFVKRSAVNAKERAESLHEGTEKFNANLENYMTRYVKGYVSLLGGLADAAHANVEHALSTVEKVAEAKSVSEAVTIQTDFVRENATQNMERVRDAANIARETVTEGVDAVRDAASKMWGTKKAA